MINVEFGTKCIPTLGALAIATLTHCLTNCWWDVLSLVDHQLDYCSVHEHSSAFAPVG